FTLHELSVPPEPAFNENEQALLSRLIGLDGDESEGLLTNIRETAPVIPSVENRRPLFASLTEEDDVDYSDVTPETEVTPAFPAALPQVEPKPRRSTPKDVALSFALSAAKQSLLYVQSAAKQSLLYVQSAAKQSLLYVSPAATQ